MTRATMTSNPGCEGGFESSQSLLSNSNSSAKISLSGAEWYSQQAHRAVNQAIGRVIRHRFDYGAILFLDSRFGEPRNQQGMSKWIRPCFETDKGVGPAIGSLVRFYKGAQKFTELNKAMRKEIVVKPKIHLKYENIEAVDTEEDGNAFVDGITKVSFVKAGNDQINEEVGFIPSDKVIKEVHLKDHLVSRNESDMASKIRNRLKTQAKKLNINMKENAQSGAKAFFHLAMATLSSEDMNQMKSILVSMKSLGHEKATNAYLIKAKSLVTILLQYDPYRLDCQTLQKSDKLIESFLPLLPPPCRHTIEKRACQMRYDNSTLKDQLMKIFSAEECNVLDEKVPFIMVYHNRANKENEDNKTWNRKSLLREYVTIFKMIMKYTKDAAATLFVKNHLYPLIPDNEKKNLAFALNEYKASLRMKAMKENDNKRYGESAIKGALFQKPIENTITSNNDITDLEESESKRAILRTKAKKFDEQQKIWEVSRNKLRQQSMKRKKSSSQSNSLAMEKKTKQKSSVFSKAAVHKKVINGSLSPMEQVHKCLEEAQTEIYKKVHPKKLSMNQVKSNAPSGTVCSICNDTVKDVSVWHLID